MPYNPISTYRIQFSKEFTFNDLNKNIDYLHQLGIKTIYASPIFQAQPGSAHGYDVANPHKLNPELGSLEDFERLQTKLKQKGIGWVQDIVPNHMAFSEHNPWIVDLFERGAHSSYYNYFDILWKHPDPSLPGKVMYPILGSLLDQAVLNHEINLQYHNKSFVLAYFDKRIPLDVMSYNNILKALPADELPAALDALTRKMFKTLTQINSWGQLKEELYQLYSDNPDIQKYIDNCLKAINCNTQKLVNIIDIQVFSPTYWKASRKLINYRRFFTINHLISLNMQSSTVFNDYHAYVFDLIKQGYFQGLRIDHIDGLLEPGEYLAKLRQHVGKETYMVVEKILEKDENPEITWPIEGTTGYDFLALVNNLLTYENSENYFNESYGKIRKGKQRAFQDQVYNKKKFILHEHMAGDLDNLFSLFKKLTEDIPHKFKEEKLQQAVTEFLLACPVYRIYKHGETFTHTQLNLLKKTFDHAEKRNPKLKKPLRFLKAMFIDPNHYFEAHRLEIDSFFNRCMQYTGPLMAKGVEDTAFYTFNRHVAHNEVGDSPSYFGLTTKEFHSEMVKAQQNWPLRMNTTSTHDTKRGEDARARLNVLADIPEEWFEKVAHWRELNKHLKTFDKDRIIPTANDEFFIYQSIVGSLPMHGQPDESFKLRLNEYLVKVLREAKAESSWADPDETYEQYTLSFAQKILDEKHGFLADLQSFHKKINQHSINNALVQVILKLTCPGVPDIYQGCETWNFSFVDPDNRRPVDYQWLQQTIGQLSQQNPNKLLKNPEDGQVKVWLTHTLLQLRNTHPMLFQHGEYIPLEVKGKYKSHVMAFARHYREKWLLVIVPLHLAYLQNKKGISEWQNINWKNTRIVLPNAMPERLIALADNAEAKKAKKSMNVQGLFQKWPFAVFTGDKLPTDKQAGILTHITSLPGKYPSGGFGKEAYRFVDFLEASLQQYWQILPFNQTTEETAFSPYSSVSAFAGNTLFIDPDELVQYHLLSPDDIKYQNMPIGMADFKATKAIKLPMLEKAYKQFVLQENHPFWESYHEFCRDEAYWLDDYALFMALRESFNHATWNNWPEQYRLRDKEALEQYAKDNHEAVEKEKFYQFLFHYQWKKIKTYANNKGIQLYGDIPIYVSYNSADVWANPSYFKLDDKGQMTHVAGVPPDYFNEDGQYWGMPIFNWVRLKNDNYQWWTDRLKKNLEMVDLLRIDHFRAFSNYWEIPFNAPTAKQGTWVDGPKDDFFMAMQKHFPDMPFVAEDLGDVDQAVYDLRDRYKLPGMSVLQFGFGSDYKKSVHAPHNHTYNSVVYTGTHDNNTTLGWYQKETNKAILKKLKRNIAGKPKEKNIHEVLTNLAYASPAKLCIVPMQDILGEDGKQRMNKPSTETGNWVYRVKEGDINQDLAKNLQKRIKQAGRG